MSVEKHKETSSQGPVIKREKQTVEAMIRLYCRRAEGNTQLCKGCRELLEYAHGRLERCVYGEEKGVCKQCPIHCYNAEMRAQIRRVMRYVGPRMLLLHPLQVLKHWLVRGG